MENKYFVRIQEQKFGFIVEGIHDIDETTDHAISNEDYAKFFELQSEGKQFRVKENPTGDTLFDLVEEYIPEAVPAPVNISMEERVEALEMVMLELLDGGAM